MAQSTNADDMRGETIEGPDGTLWEVTMHSLEADELGLSNTDGEVTGITMMDLAEEGTGWTVVDETLAAEQAHTLTVAETAWVETHYEYDPEATGEVTKIDADFHPRDDGRTATITCSCGMTFEMFEDGEAHIERRAETGEN